MTVDATSEGRRRPQMRLKAVTERTKHLLRRARRFGKPEPYEPTITRDGVPYKIPPLRGPALHAMANNTFTKEK